VLPYPVIRIQQMTRKPLYNSDMHALLKLHSPSWSLAFANTLTPACMCRQRHISLSGCQLLYLTSTHARYLKHGLGTRDCDQNVVLGRDQLNLFVTQQQGSLPCQRYTFHTQMQIQKSSKQHVIDCTCTRTSELQNFRRLAISDTAVVHNIRDAIGMHKM
jgi:hypothetical protein